MQLWAEVEEGKVNLWRECGRVATARRSHSHCRKDLYNARENDEVVNEGRNCC
jgi:hypothetical protein